MAKKPEVKKVVKGKKIDSEVKGSSKFRSKRKVTSIGNSKNTRIKNKNKRRLSGR